MNCYLKQIGIISNNDEVYVVNFDRGLNIVTGASQKGKSALLEIFDYCLASDTSTIPKGVITEKAASFFVVFSFVAYNLMLGRDINSKTYYLKEVNKDDSFNIKTLFSPEFKLSDKPYKKQLASYFQINMSTVDEEKPFGNPAPTPSVRSFPSFMLQHQNLIANKHALFYRFDTKEKSEQVINHFLLFMGLVNEDYISRQREIDDLKNKIRQLERAIPSKKVIQDELKNQIESALAEYELTTGTSLLNSISNIIANPEKSLKSIRDQPDRLAEMGVQVDEFYQKLESEYSERLGKLRQLKLKRTQIQSSIDKIKRVKDNLLNISAPQSSDLALSNECPFCEQKAFEQSTVNEKNKLTNAINWLNEELSQSEYMKETLNKDLNQLNDNIIIEQKELKRLSEQLNDIQEKSAELRNKQNISEQVIRAKIKVETLIEQLLNGDLGLSTSTAELENLKIEKEKLEELNKDFEFVKNKTELQSKIINAINDVAKNFDFEQFLKKAHIEFDIESFDLVFKEGTNKTTLAEMGSGSNWLYVHLSLFLGLLKVFCQYSNCKIPPILMLDQPTQVFFPSFVNDTSKSFEDAIESIGNNNKVESDLKTVESIFSLLAHFCIDTGKETGVIPQIIVMDHADNLTIGNLEFEQFVKARWRDENSALISQSTLVKEC